MSRLSELRSRLFDADPSCWWPGCTVTQPSHLDAAHLRARGMGHRGARDTIDNLALLCNRWSQIGHHQMLDRESTIPPADATLLLREAARRGRNKGMAACWWPECVAAMRSVNEFGFQSCDAHTMIVLDLTGEGSIPKGSLRELVTPIFREKISPFGT